jgi:hypothetical protein
MSDAPRPPVPAPDPAMVKAWAEYAKDRFASADARIAEYRSWARQLIAVIGVVIGLEVTIVARLALDATPPLHVGVRTLSLALLLFPLGVQFFALRWLLHVGYRGEHLLGPESPTILGDYLADKDQAEAHRVIGAYYAKAYDHFHGLAEKLGKDVAAATRRFQWTLLPVLLSVSLLAIGALSSPPRSGTYKTTMVDRPTTSPESIPASRTPKEMPNPAKPQATENPLLITPTQGQVVTESEKPVNRRHL